MSDAGLRAVSRRKEAELLPVAFPSGAWERDRKNGKLLENFLDIALHRFIIAVEGGDVLPMCEDECLKGGPTAEGELR